MGKSATRLITLLHRKHPPCKAWIPPTPIPLEANFKMVRISNKCGPYCRGWSFQEDIAENHCEGWTRQTVGQCMQENATSCYISVAVFQCKTVQNCIKTQDVTLQIVFSCFASADIDVLRHWMIIVCILSRRKERAGKFWRGRWSSTMYTMYALVFSIIQHTANKFVWSWVTEV